MRRLIRMLGAWRRRRSHLRHFMTLSDRTLADIGLRRADVHAAMMGRRAAWRTCA
jgi:uncharacterized protein YjiS (DUF1127 family)